MLYLELIQGGNIYLQRGFTSVHICTPVLQLKNVAIEKIVVSFILFVIV